MLIKIKSKKTTASNWLLGVFTVLLLFGAAFSHFFQAPTDHNYDLSKFTSLFSSNTLENSDGITLSNQLGVYSLQKRVISSGDKWSLVSPRKLEAKAKFVNKLIDTLKKIKIKKIFNKDPISLSNFSLNDPTISILLENSVNGTSETLQIGLTNPIDNSTYVTFKDKDAIFQVDSLVSPIETYDLAMFIDSNVFPSSTKIITQLEIYRGRRSGRAILTLKRKENIWFDHQGREINQDRAKEFIDKMASLKSQIILDKIDKAQQKRIDRYTAKPSYTIVLTENGIEVSYLATGLISTLPGIKNEKWQSLIITSSNKTHPMIVSKDALNIFNKRPTHFRKMQIKKLFY
ncbi:MAG: DUF4340 domain-containing protein [Bacteriovoracaceae bacterium]|nr:DUF4340 domain-containing protein [Bacteriovoracaceae bacterium]